MRRYALAMSAAALALSACGGTSPSSAPQPSQVVDSPVRVSSSAPDSGATSPATGFNDQLHNAVAWYETLMVTGAPKAAYHGLSARCRGILSEDDFIERAKQAQADYGDASIANYVQQVDGDSATVSFTTEGSTSTNISEQWVHEHGEWYDDDC